MKVNKFSIITLLIVATATISLITVSISSANAQDLPEQQPPASDGSDETQTPPVETPPSSSGVETDEVNTDSDSENVEQSYAPGEVLIRYKDPAPVLENEDETGTIYLRGPMAYEATFVSRGLAVVSEDFASVGVDTATLEIFGGVESSNTYFVRFNADIDPPQLSSQLRAIDRIDWAQPNYLYSWESDSVGDNPCRYCDGSWWLDDIDLDNAYDFVQEHKGNNKPKVAIIDVGFDRNNNAEYLGQVSDAETFGSGYRDRWHGTLVTNILSGLRDNEVVAYGIYNEPNSIIHITILDDDSATFVEAVNYAREKGANLISASVSNKKLRVGLDSPTCESINDNKVIADGAVHYAIDNFPGLYVTSASNFGRRISIDDNVRNKTISSPSIFAKDIVAGDGTVCFEALDNLLVVAATQQNSDGEIELAQYSSTISPGSNFGADYVKIAAPGKNLLTTGFNREKDFFDGTSAATPIVAGVAALVLQVNPNLAPTQVIKIITETAKIVPHLKQEENGIQRVEGGRSVDANKAVQCAQRLKTGGSLSQCATLLESTPIVQDTRSVSERQYVDTLFDGAVFTKNVNIDTSDPDEPKFYEVSRYIQLPDEQVEVFNYEDRTRDVYNYENRTRNVYNYEDRTRDVYNYEDRTRAVYNYETRTRNVYHYETRWHNVYHYETRWRERSRYEDRTRSVYNYETRTRSVYNYETRRTTCKTSFLGICLSWNTVRVRVAPFTETYRVRVAPFTETYRVQVYYFEAYRVRVPPFTESYRVRIAPYTENYEVRVAPFSETYRVRVAPFSETYRVRVSPYTENYRVRVAPFSETYRVRVEPRFVSEERFGREIMTVAASDVIRTGQNPDTNINPIVEITVNTDYLGSISSCDTICEAYKSELENAPVRARFNYFETQGSVWSGTVNRINGFRDYDKENVYGDVGKISTFEVFQIYLDDGYSLSLDYFGYIGPIALYNVKGIVETANNDYADGNQHSVRESYIRSLFTDES